MKLTFAILILFTLAFTTLNAFQTSFSNNIDGTGDGLVDSIKVERICSGYGQQHPNKYFICFKNGNSKFYGYSTKMVQESTYTPNVYEISKRNSTPFEDTQKLDQLIKDIGNQCDNEKSDKQTDAQCIQSKLSNVIKNYYVSVVTVGFGEFMLYEYQNMAPENQRKVHIFGKDIYVTLS